MRRIVTMRKERQHGNRAGELGWPAVIDTFQPGHDAATVLVEAVCAVFEASMDHEGKEILAVPCTTPVDWEHPHCMSINGSRRLVWWEPSPHAEEGLWLWISSRRFAIETLAD